MPRSWVWRKGGEIAEVSAHRMKSDWRGVLGTHATKAAAIEMARMTIDMALSKNPTVNKLPRAKSLWEIHCDKVRKQREAVADG